VDARPINGIPGVSEAGELKEHINFDHSCDEEIKGLTRVVEVDKHALVTRAPDWNTGTSGELPVTPSISSNDCLHAHTSRTRSVSEESDCANEADDSLGHEHRGVSVHHLRKELPLAIEKAGLSCDDSIYSIECDVIRAAGASTTCPRDGRLGAAYVDCISGSRNAGPASFMLSYTWGYNIQDIIDTLHDFCKTRGLAKSKTYIWICCLCVNQHRVRSNPTPLPFHEFRDTLKARVFGIGKVIAMISPWNDPIYIKRAWCIFEMYTAVTENLELEVVMPERERVKFYESLAKGSTGLYELWKALAGLDVRQASAYILSDRNSIMQMVENDVGFTHLNTVVSERLVEWMLRVAQEHTNDVCLDGSADMSLKAYSCLHVGRLHYTAGHLDNAALAYMDGLKHCDQDGVIATAVGCELLIGMAQVELERGNFSQQRRYNEQAKEVLRQIGELSTNEGAQLLWSMATYCKDEVGDLKQAREFYEQAKNIRKMRGTWESHEGASIDWGLADVARKQGDLKAALEGFNSVSALLKSIDSLETPCGAWVAFSLAHIYLEMGQLDSAYEGFFYAKYIRQKLGILQVTDGAAVFLGLAETQRRRGCFIDAMANVLAFEDIVRETGVSDNQSFLMILGNRTICDFKKQVESQISTRESKGSVGSKVSSSNRAPSWKARTFSFLSAVTGRTSDLSFAYTQSRGSSSGSSARGPRHVA